MKKFIPLVVIGALGFAAYLFFTYAPSVSAIGIMDGVNAARGTNQPATLFGDSGVITVITNTLLFIAGALSVIMIIFGGFRYVVSGGKAASVTAAKNTILYAIVGLIIAFLAFAVVNWILGSVGSGFAGGNGIAPTNL